MTTQHTSFPQSQPNQQVLITSTVPALFQLVAAVVLAAGLIVSAQTMRSGAAFTDKSLAVQGCLEIAKKLSVTTGKSASSDWRVEESAIDQAVVAECLKQKGY